MLVPGIASTIDLAMEDEGSGFYAQPHPSLRRHGFASEQPEVFCVGETLMIRQDDAGGFDISPAMIERLRLGVIGTKSELYHVARLVLMGEDEPLLIMPKTPRDPGYALTMRRFARVVAQTRGLDRLEHGLTTASALMTLLVVAAICLGASLMALLVWSEEHGMGGAIVFTAVMAGAVALVAWEAFAREMPRTMASLDEIDRYLPLPRRLRA